MHRISDIRNAPAVVRFLSCEPLLGPLNKLPLEGIDWVIVGGESGPYARPMNVDWVKSIFRQCKENDVPFFFSQRDGLPKQWGGVRKDITGRKLFGRTYNDMPKIPTVIAA